MNAKRLTAALLLLFAGALTAGAQTIDGDWQGTLSAGPVELKVVLHLAADGQGGYKASLDSPDQGAKDIPVASARFADSSLTFQVPPIGGSYTGKADASLKTITGTWSQGGMSAPLTFTRFVAAAAKPRVPKPSDIDGDWDGTLAAPGASLRIVVHIATFEDGMTATLDSPDQGAKDIPDLERSNVVCHYQNTPFYEGIPHVSRLQKQTAFPFAVPRK